MPGNSLLNGLRSETGAKQAARNQEAGARPSLICGRNSWIKNIC